MGLFEGLAGAVGGLLSTGSPIGAIAGGISGLFGGDNEQEQRMTQRPLSGAQTQLVGGASSNLDAIFARLDPNQRDLMSSRLGKKFSGILGDAATRSFDRQAGTAVANLQRTGGGPSSIMASQLGEIGGARTRAIQEAEMQGELMGEQVSTSRYGLDLNAGSTLGGIINQTYQGQGTSQVSGSQGGGNFGSIMGGIGASLTDPNSYYSQNQGKFGMFSAPIFGSPKKSNYTNPYSRSQLENTGSRFGMIPETPGQVQGPQQFPSGGTPFTGGY